MRRAACLIRDLPHYRRDAFISGLTKAGFSVSPSASPTPRPDDLLVVWNRYGGVDRTANRYEAVGAQVIVVENGWAGCDQNGRQHYAIALHHHNGAGEWHVGEEDRWTPLGVETWPWRKTGSHVLVLPQRGIGPPGVAMPLDWVGSVLGRLRAVTDRPVKVRPHPGKERPPLDQDFTDAWAAVTWGSGAGIKAIIAGIPVFHELESWIGAPAARFGISDIESPFLGDRLPMLKRLAWAQWGVDDISAGEPFRWLVR